MVKYIRRYDIRPQRKFSFNLCLKWNDFQENLNSAFGGFRNDEKFSDVTLACEDGAQIETHKVILAASSPVPLSTSS